ncbi:hypothetical protein EDD16DRAFT_1691098 [Pisolithus croceorrhizus]|nr:hypothetical protein EDD16DRAFT_1691098 [Pisolithus croceorrhizus]KAI6160469.1 hypothetical protein EDD17DRAFT_1778366 [Pisolithus thermaeus]
MAKDPAQCQGPDLVKEGIAFEHGIQLSRDFVTNEMCCHDPGPHHEWSGDGHDKLTSIGFPIWGVIPNNHLKNAIAYLYLRTIAEVGGMPLQMTTDCGSETTKVFGLGLALCEQFAPHLSTEALPPHCFLHSVWNIVIKQGWLCFRLQWGANARIWWDAGEGIYNSTDPKHEELVQWLWPTFIQHELDQLKEHFNNHPTHFDAAKKLPSGVSPNVAIALAAEYGGESQLIAIDCAVVHHLMEEIGGESLIEFVDREFTAHAQVVFDSLGMEITPHNIWQVFTKMLPLVYG